MTLAVGSAQLADSHLLTKAASKPPLSPELLLRELKGETTFSLQKYFFVSVQESSSQVATAFIPHLDFLMASPEEMGVKSPCGLKKYISWTLQMPIKSQIRPGLSLPLHHGECRAST